MYIPTYIIFNWEILIYMLTKNEADIIIYENLKFE